MKESDEVVTKLFTPVVDKANPQFWIIGNNNVGTNQVKRFNMIVFMTRDIIPNSSFLVENLCEVSEISSFPHWLAESDGAFEFQE